MNKKILIVVFILTSMLYGAESLTHYDQALKLFKEKKYNEAYELLYALSKNDLGNQNLNFYLGRCAYEQGQYDIAISYYERILFMQPRNLKTKIEIAQSNLMLKNYTQARNFFNEVIGNINTPFDIQEKIKAKLLYIENRVQKHFFSGAFIFDLNYDSNVNNSASEGDYSIFVPQLGIDLTLSNNGEEKSDYYYDAIAVLNYVYKQKENVSLNNNFVFYTQYYDTKENSNLNVASLTLNEEFYEGTNKYSAGLGIDYIRFDNKNYLKNYNLLLSNSHVFTERRLNDLRLKMSKRSYDNSDDKTKNSYVFNLTNSLNQYTEDYGLFTLKTSFNKELAINTTRTDVNKTSYDVSLSNSLNLPNKYSINTMIGSEKILYGNKDVNFLTKRVDKINTLSLGITKLIRKNLVLSLLGTVKNNISNQEPFDYKKHIIKSSLIYTF